jgi:hypothetical protein
MTASAPAAPPRFATPALLRPLVIVLAAAANTVLFFRYSVLTGFAEISGDRWDGRYILAIHEHWYHVWSLEAPWRRANFYHPAPDSLGYTDGFALHGAIYSLWRALGLDWYASSELTAIGFKLIGFIGFYRLATRLLRVRPAWALLGASLFFQLNATSVHATHSQFLVLNLFPLLLEAVIAFARALAEGERNRAFLAGLAGAALYALSLLSGFYMSWYLFLFVVTATLIWLVRRPIAAARALRGAAVIAIRGRWVLPTLAACSVLLLLLPMIALYRPVMQDTGMHDMTEIRSFAGKPADIVNVGPGNIVWSRLLERATETLTGEPMGPGERASGIAPGLLLLGLIGAVHLWRRPGPYRPAARALIAAAVLLWLASVRIGPILGWEFIANHLPFGRATRVPPRLQIFLALPIVLAATIWLDRVRWFDTPARFIVLAALLVLEEVYVGSAHMQRAVEDRLLAALPPPPPECRSFFVSRAMEQPGMSKEIRDFVAPEMDAVVVAERFNLPTLNGSGAFAPPGWDLNVPDDPTYRERVLRYARAHGVAEGLCSLDAEAGRWELVAR